MRLDSKVSFWTLCKASTFRLRPEPNRRKDVERRHEGKNQQIGTRIGRRRIAINQALLEISLGLITIFDLCSERLINTLMSLFEAQWSPRWAQPPQSMDQRSGSIVAVAMNLPPNPRLLCATDICATISNQKAVHSVGVEEIGIRPGLFDRSKIMTINVLSVFCHKFQGPSPFTHIRARTQDEVEAPNMTL